MFYQICTLVLLVSIALAIPPPSYIKICHTKDPNFKACVLESAIKAIPEIAKGDKRFKILPINPLRVPSLTVKQFGFEINFKNMSVYGFEESKLTDFEYTGDQIKMTFHVPKIRIYGDYAANGKVIVIPINGSGASNITAIEGDYTMITSLATIDIDGVKHLKFLDSTLDMKMQKAIFYFENLFRDDDLKIDINQLLNENWQDVLNDVGGAIKETVIAVYKQNLSNLFERIPKKDLFPN